MRRTTQRSPRGGALRDRRTSRAQGIGTPSGCRLTVVPVTLALGGMIIGLVYLFQR